MMDQAEARWRALAELGDLSAEELPAFMQKTYGVMVRPQFVPILKATLKDKEMLAEWRRRSQKVAQADGATSASAVARR
jgi:hypothetical protein